MEVFHFRQHQENTTKTAQINYFTNFCQFFATKIVSANFAAVDGLESRDIFLEIGQKKAEIEKVHIILVSGVKLAGSKKVWDEKSGRSTAQDCFLGQVIIRRDLREKFTINYYVYVKKV